MSNTTSKTVSSTPINSLGGHIFVRKFDPFVCQPNKSLLPFVWTNIPNTPFTPHRSRIRGFTMIELVVTMIVAALIAAFVIPNIRVVIKDSRISTQINDLKADFNYARSEAVKRRSDDMVCQSTNGTDCIGAAGDWKDGRLIFVDKDKDRVVSNGDIVLRYRGAVGGADRSLKVDVTDPVVFLQTGGTTGPRTFTICDEQGTGKGKQLSLSQTGLTVMLTAPLTSCN